MTNLPAMQPPSGQEGQYGKFWLEFAKDVGKVALPFAAGYFAHILASRRERQKELRTKAEQKAVQAAANAAALHLTNEEREILHHCGNVDGWEKGRLWIMQVDAFGRWVRAGKRDFFSQTDPSIAARYLDAFESLYRRGYFSHEGGLLYRLTGIGYERAKQNT